MAASTAELLDLLTTLESRASALVAKHVRGTSRAVGMAEFRAFGVEADRLLRYSEFVEQKLIEARVKNHEELMRRVAPLRWQTMLLRLRLAHEYFSDMLAGRRPRPIGIDSVVRAELEQLDLLELYYQVNMQRADLGPPPSDLIQAMRVTADELIASATPLADFSNEAAAQAEREAENRYHNRMTSPRRRHGPAKEKPRLSMNEDERRSTRIKLPTIQNFGQRYLARDAQMVVAKARQVLGLSNADVARKIGLADTQFTMLIGGHDPVPPSVLDRLEAVLSGLDASAFSPARTESHNKATKAAAAKAAESFELPPGDEPWPEDPPA